MHHRPASRTAHRDRGANMVEYVGLTVVAASVLTAIAMGGMREDIPRETREAICQITGDCPREDPAGGGAANGPGGRTGGEPRGDGPIEVRPAPVVQPVGAETDTLDGIGDSVAQGLAWLLPPGPPVHPGREDCRAAAEQLNEEGVDIDLREWLGGIRESLEEGDTTYRTDFIRCLDDADNDLAYRIFAYALEEYDEDGNSGLSESELSEACSAVGSIAREIGSVVTHGRMPENEQNAMFDTMDLDSQALMLACGSATFPPDMVVAAARDILGNEDDTSIVSDARLNALHALARNPRAAQLFLSRRDGLALAGADLVGDGDGTGRGPAAITDVLEAALGLNEGGERHRQAMATAILSVNDFQDYFLSDDYANARMAFVEALDRYQPWMSRVGQRDIGLHPGNDDPPGTPLPVSGDEFTDFLGVVMTDPESRGAFNDMLRDHIGEQGLAGEFADSVARIPEGDLEGYFDEREEALQVSNEIGGLAAIAVQGQNEAHLDGEERLEANLSLYDTVASGLNDGISRAAGAAASRVGIPPQAASRVASEVVDGATDYGRDRLSDSLQEEVDALNPGIEAQAIINEMTGDLESDVRDALRAEGLPANDRYVDVMTEEIGLVLRGELTPVLIDVITNR